VLLPVAGLVRRADGVVVIGAALVAKAAGLGHRPIARLLGRPAGTVRGWLRRFTARAEGLRAAFTALLVELAVDPPVLMPAGSAVGDAVAAIVAAAEAAAARLLVAVSPWELAGAVTSGRLLAPAGW
jgi:hypothetical protein